MIRIYVACHPGEYVDVDRYTIEQARELMGNSAEAFLINSDLVGHRPWPDGPMLTVRDIDRIEALP